MLRVDRAGLAIGAALALAVGAEYPAALACLPIAALAFVDASRARSSSRAAALVLGALPFIVVVMVAHTAMWGAPWRTGYSFLENHEYQGVVAGTFFGIGAPHLGVLATVLFSPSVGLFFFSPMLLIGLAFAARSAARRDPRAIAVLVGCALMLLFIAGFRGWRGGWSVGPRYISEVAGLLAVDVALAFDALSRASPQRARIALALLAAIGVVHSGVAGMFFPHLPDLFDNPVYEMMLPLVRRGFAPDSLPILLGLPPLACAILLIIALASPLLVAARSPAVALAAVVAVVAVAVAGSALADNTSASTPQERAYANRAAHETRRMMDNWRPDRGDPYLADDESPDARTLYAIDRARFALPIARADDCAVHTSGEAHGTLAPVVDEINAPALLVVPDRYALALIDVRGAAPLTIIDADLPKALASLPCSGTIYVARAQGEPLPPVLRSLPEIARHEANVDHMELIELERR